MPLKSPPGNLELWDCPFSLIFSVAGGAPLPFPLFLCAVICLALIRWDDGSPQRSTLSSSDPLAFSPLPTHALFNSRFQLFFCDAEREPRESWPCPFKSLQSTPLSERVYSPPLSSRREKESSLLFRRVNRMGECLTSFFLNRVTLPVPP